MTKRADRTGSRKSWSDARAVTDPLPPDELPDEVGLSPKRVRKLLDRYRVTDGSGFRLKDHDPGDTAGLSLDKKEARLLLDGGIERLISLQEKLYARNSWALLCCFQAMDAAGKDGTIKHVMSGVNPQGVQVTSFKAPGPEDLDHDFLWRISRALPDAAGSAFSTAAITRKCWSSACTRRCWNRSNCRKGRVTKHIWDERLEAIAAYREVPSRSRGRWFSNSSSISREANRSAASLAAWTSLTKNWKFEPGDLAERQFWDAYMDAYQRAIRATATPHAPWFVIPADHKWFARLAVVTAIVEVLDELDLEFPKLGKDGEAGLALARAALESEGEG